MNTNQSVWEHHYRQEKSKQSFPDENVVRYLKKLHQVNPWQDNFRSLDCGVGSGRNFQLLKSFPGQHFACDFAFESIAANENHCQASILALPYQTASFDFILCWGVLHYLPKNDIPKAIHELKRTLKPGGRIFCTIRSAEDTHLARTLTTGDLKGGSAQLFSKAESIELFKSFTSVNYGYIERQPLGEAYRIAHHMLEAVA